MDAEMGAEMCRPLKARSAAVGSVLRLGTAAVDMCGSYTAPAPSCRVEGRSVPVSPADATPTARFLWVRLSRCVWQRSDPYRGADGDPMSSIKRALPKLEYSRALLHPLQKYEYYEQGEGKWIPFPSPHLDLSCGVEVNSSYTFRLTFDLQLTGRARREGICLMVSAQSSLAAMLDVTYRYNKQPIQQDQCAGLEVLLTMKPKAIGSLPAELLGKITVTARNRMQDVALGSSVVWTFARITAPKRHRRSKPRAHSVRDGGTPERRRKHGHPTPGRRRLKPTVARSLPNKGIDFSDMEQVRKLGQNMSRDHTMWATRRATSLLGLRRLRHHRSGDSKRSPRKNRLPQSCQGHNGNQRSPSWNRQRRIEIAQVETLDEWERRHRQ